MMDPFKTHGAFSWQELMTDDVAAAKDFYGGLFGWSFEQMCTGEMAYTVIKTGGQEIGGIMAKPPQAAGAPNMWQGYVTVDDVDAIASKAEQLGGRLLLPPKDIPDVGRIACIQDTQGAVVCAVTYLSRP